MREYLVKIAGLCSLPLAQGCFTASIVGTFYAPSPEITLSKPAIPIGSQVTFTLSGGVEPYTLEASSGTVNSSAYTAPSTLDTGENQREIKITVRDRDLREATQKLWVYRPGSLDTTFGDNGQIIFGTQQLSTVFVDSQDRIYAKAALGGEVKLYRFLHTGVLDSNFGTSGTHTLNIGMTVTDPNIHHLRKDSDGNLLVAGYYYSSGFYRGAFRLLKDGIQDFSYGTGGGKYISGPGDAQYALVDEQDRLYILGSGGFGSGVHQVTRLTNQGVPDSTYSGTGTAPFTTNGGTQNSVRHGFFTSDGALILTGLNTRALASYDSILGRLESDGTPSPTFSPTVVTPPGVTGNSTEGIAVLPHPTTSTFYWVISEWSPASFIHVGKRNLDGSAETTWQTSGWRPRMSSIAYDAKLDSRNAVMVCGINSGSTSGMILRMLPNGNLDSNFATNGIFDINDAPTLQLGACLGFEYDSLGRIVMVGTKIGGGAGVIARVWN